MVRHRWPVAAVLGLSLAAFVVLWILIDWWTLLPFAIATLLLYPVAGSVGPGHGHFRSSTDRSADDRVHPREGDLSRSLDYLWKLEKGGKRFGR